MLKTELYETIGKRVRNVDSFEKVTSAGRYVNNYTCEGMLHAKILRSTVAHARVKRIDTRKALALRGVRAVITHADCPKVRYSPMLALETSAPQLIRDKLILEDHVRYYGDEVAAVAADDEETAREALDLIEVEYEEISPVFTPDQAMGDSAPKLHEVDRNIAKTNRVGWGNTEEGLRQADFTFEETYQTSRTHPCPLETHVCVCSPDGKGGIIVLSSTQHISGLRERLSTALQIPIRKISVVRPPYIGGGFGAKVEMNVEPICALLSLKTGRPVRLALSREEEFLATPRMPVKIILKTGVNKGGLLVARYAEGILDTGAHAAHGAVIHGVMTKTFLSMYKCSNSLCETKVVYTNNPTGGSTRGSTGPQIVFAVEQQMDQIASEMKIDPVSLRIENSWQLGDANPFLYPNLNMPISSFGLKECLIRGADSFNWHAKKRIPKNPNEALRRGVGFACIPLWVSGTMGIPPYMEVSGAIVKMNEDGSANLIVATVDQGAGQNTVLSQIVAEVLGISVDDVVIADADTNIAPADGPTHASRTTYSVGNSVKLAAEDARKKLLTLAAREMKCTADDLVVERGTIRKIRGAESLTYSQVVRRGQYGTPGESVIGVATTTPPGNAPPSAAIFAEVEVDTMTGRVKVIEVVSANDVGRAINLDGVEGQVHGAIRQGIGYALSEEMVSDAVSGMPLTSNLLDYRMITSVDMPKIRVLTIESNDPTGPFGAKGIGEPALIPTAPAIANAIFDAVGVRIKTLPITPEKILKTLEDKERDD
ncbi:MAG TPA: molybdopterin cofactor-binding domain-containing protein [Nitrososphaerales archaeon]|nr:molybdopterin cofactor-binding domain-containing protein [Nitrososphaerales archaeon]